MSLRRVEIVALVAAAVAQGCSHTATPKDIGELAKTYADLLMAQQSVRNDTAAAHKNIDSTLAAHGFDNEMEFREKLKEIGRDPEVMRKIFDSTQQLLQAVTNEALPPPPSTPK